jgi:hypothetical protein
MAEKTPTPGAAPDAPAPQAAAAAATTAELPLLDRIIQEGKMARDE